MSLLLTENATGLRVIAESDGLLVQLPPEAAGFEAVRLQVEQLLELGLAEERPDLAGALVSWSNVGEALELDIGLPVRWTIPSPFMLSITRVGDIGRPDFRYEYSFLHGGRRVGLQRVGYMVRRGAGGQVYHLDSQTFALVHAMDQFNALLPDEKSAKRSWLIFAEVKGCAQVVGAALDRYLESNDVVVPSHLAVSVQEHEDGAVSFVPKTPDEPQVPEEALARQFLRSSSEPGMYYLDGTAGNRVRVVFDDRQMEALRRMRQARALRGERKKSAVEHPEQFFDGVQDVVDIQFGKRVLGIGEFEFAPMPAVAGQGGGFLEIPGLPDSGAPSGNPGERDRPTAITVPNPNGGPPVRLAFPDTATRMSFQEKVRAAIARGDAVVEHDGVAVAATTELVEALQQPVPLDGAKGPNPGNKYLLIYTDEEDVQAEDAAAIALAAGEEAMGIGELELPLSLDGSVQLKPHQQQGVRWLQQSIRQPGRRGVLLADDMGLGKTLQVLVHLAWCIEKGFLRLGDDDRPPWRPILIVAPLILIENESWTGEMERFFRHQGDIFGPILRLHGTGVDAVRRVGQKGRETVLGEASLDHEKLRQYRTVLTNYETVVNYQFSLAQKVNGKALWSVLVTDEAQKYKAMNTKISHALKALEPDFHIACSGTPVENRLLDLWNIFDTVQPALLGSAREFSQKYERPLEQDPRAPLDALREELRFGRPNAFIVRRDKRQLPGLPEKREVPLYCMMTESEVQRHLDLVSALREERRPGAHLGALQRLAALYQHPSLLTVEDEEWDPPALLAQSAKLRSVVAKLREIRSRGEKAIVFAGLVRMQQILAQVFRSEFGLPVQIVNGGTSRQSGDADPGLATRRGRDTRQAILRQFRERPGFHVIILSPFVAGVGLTLTEANHVIHYGRWWNPALEDQATDRVYRIGQEKDVEVHLPILQDPSGRLGKTFDERLHDLIARKRALRTDFLRPSETEEAYAGELLGELLNFGAASTSHPVTPLNVGDIAGLDPYQFEALVACVFERQGAHCILTPKANDGGADVIAVKGRRWTAVQAKHSRNRHVVDDTPVAETLAAGEIFTQRLGPGGHLCVVTNSAFSPAAVQAASRSGVELMGGQQIVEAVTRFGITMADVFARVDERAMSFDEVIRRSRAYLG